MKLERSVISLSITDTNRECFKLLDSIRPNYISFSGFLGVAAQEYAMNHKSNSLKIDDFTSKDIVQMPLFYSEIDMWKKYVDNMPKSDIKKLQKRHAQIGNLINKKVQGMLA